MTDLTSLLERADRAVSGVPLPSGGVERLRSLRDRKRRNQRIAAGVVGMAVFVASVWIVTTGGPFDRTQTPGTSGPAPGPPSVTGPSPYPESDRVGLIGLPPEGATPSTPSTGELVLRVMFGHTMGDPGTFHVNVYADGRLIWQRLGDYTGAVHEDPTGLLEQRLTPEGVELVRAEVISTGLFDHDLHLASAASVYGLYFGQIEVHNGDRLVRVTWGDVGPEDVPGEWPTPEQASALQRLDARLADPASWLPASAWEDPEIRAYVPSRYEVCYEAQLGIGLSRVLASLPRPAEDLLRTWDRTREEKVDRSLGAYADMWCSHVATEEARALAQILEDAGIQEDRRLVGTSGVGYVVQSRDPGDGTDVRVRVSFWPLLPHEA